MAMAAYARARVNGFMAYGLQAGVPQVYRDEAQKATYQAMDWPSRLAWLGAWLNRWIEASRRLLHGRARNFNSALEFIQFFAMKGRTFSRGGAHRRHALSVELLTQLGVGQCLGHFG